MSFLDVLDSIGAGQRPATPQVQKNGPSTSSNLRPSLANADLKPAVRPPRPEAPSTVPNGSKRKADEAFRALPQRPQQPLTKLPPGTGAPSKGMAVKAPSQVSRGIDTARGVSSATATTSQTASRPPKGSFAALMAQAKVAQQQKVKSEVGQIKHQATAREKISKAQKRKPEQEEKDQRSKLGKLQSQHVKKVDKKRTSNNHNSSPKKRAQSTYKGTAKPAATTQPASSYKGTAGLASKHRPPSSAAGPKRQGINPGSRSNRYDEYLGTDEEDEGEDVDGDIDDDGMDVDVKVDEDRDASDASSDMEADAFDVEEEENRALRQAKADDARESALEERLRREKEDRKRKLQALAKKRR